MMDVVSAGFLVIFGTSTKLVLRNRVKGEETFDESSQKVMISSQWINKAAHESTNEDQGIVLRKRNTFWFANPIEEGRACAMSIRITKLV